MEQIIVELLTNWGPLAIGWIAAAGLGWLVISERKRQTPYEKISQAYHDSIVENTRAMERLATLLEERTRRR